MHMVHDNITQTPRLPINGGPLNFVEAREPPSSIATPTHFIHSRSSFVSSAPSTTFVQPRLEPPPLDYRKSPYCRVPLPEVTIGPVYINPTLQYKRYTHSHVRRRARSVCAMEAREHRCLPATTPSLGSLTIILPNDRLITVHALKDPGAVLVGDVLKALDAEVLSKAEGTYFPPEAVVQRIERREEVCSCLGGATAIDYLQSHFGAAGLRPTNYGHDIWELLIGESEC